MSAIHSKSPQPSGLNRAGDSVRHQDPRMPPLMGDDGVAEALRRAAEMRLDPSIGISLREFERRIRRRE
jgi:hypothetical protein